MAKLNLFTEASMAFKTNGTEIKNYGVSMERWGWRREGEQSRIEEYSESLPISSFSPSPPFYTPSLVLFLENSSILIHGHCL
jgi:hypothetical protein